MTYFPSQGLRVIDKGLREEDQAIISDDQLSGNWVCDIAIIYLGENRTLKICYLQWQGSACLCVGHLICLIRSSGGLVDFRYLFYEVEDLTNGSGFVLDGHFGSSLVGLVGKTFFPTSFFDVEANRQ